MKYIVYLCVVFLIIAGAYAENIKSGVIIKVDNNNVILDFDGNNDYSFYVSQNSTYNMVHNFTVDSPSQTIDLSSITNVLNNISQIKSCDNSTIESITNREVNLALKGQQEWFTNTFMPQIDKLNELQSLVNEQTNRASVCEDSFIKVNSTINEKGKLCDNQLWWTSFSLGMLLLIIVGLIGYTLFMTYRTGKGVKLK